MPLRPASPSLLNPMSPPITAQEFIFRTFNVGNYDLLKHLPENFREQQVV